MLIYISNTASEKEKNKRINRKYGKQTCPGKTILAASLLSLASSEGVVSNLAAMPARVSDGCTWKCRNNLLDSKQNKSV